MGMSPIRLLRALYRVTLGKLFPGLFRHICVLVFKDEYLHLRQQSERFTAKLELLERSLVEIFDHGCTIRRKFDAASDAPAISVIMPTYNRAHCIEDAIRSVVAQHFQNWELIVVDDGSTDTTDEILAPYLQDGRIVSITQQHHGQSSARNRALSVARGNIIAYLDSDNVALPNFLSAVAAAFNADPATDFMYGALLTRHHGDAGGGLVFEPFNRDILLRQNFIDLNTVAHRRTLFARYGGFDESLDRLTDWDLALRYTAHQPARPLAVVAAQYRSRDSSRVSDLYPHGPAYQKIRGKWA